MDTVIVLDFGSQLAHLIARRIREQGVYSEILPFDTSISTLEEKHPKGIILSGGPSSVYDTGAPVLPAEFYAFIADQQIPLLGLCYGHQLIAQAFHGKVEAHEEKEYGKTELTVDRQEHIFKDLAKQEIVWMSHGDQVAQLPAGFDIFGSTDTCPIAAFGNIQDRIYGFQFHPEVQHTVHGTQILRNFIFEVCRATPEWKLKDWIDQAIQEIRETVGDAQVLLGLSGGVDSSVVAVLLKQAIGDRVHPIFVNNGVLRKNEVEQVCEWFQEKFRFKNFHYVDAEEEFLTNLKDVVDPEQKRKVIGHTFIKIFENTAILLEKTLPKMEFLAQGTIYPDRVESQAGSGGKTSSKIKSHHNLTLPDDMTLKILEPLRDLYKYEVRKIGNNSAYRKN